MANPTRDELRRRMTKDDGDPDDQVYLPVSRASSSVSCYHRHRRCQTLRTDTECNRVTREQAQQNGKAPCKVCVLENVASHAPTLARKLEESSPEEFGLSPTPPSPDDADATADD